MKIIDKIKAMFPCSHDFDMEFPDPKSLDWIFRCNKCGHSEYDMYIAKMKQGKS